MDLTNKTEIKNLLKKYNGKPEKYLGQHFILSKKALTLILAAAGIKNEDIIIEIGSGLGTLTRELAGAGAKIIAVEKDPLMISILKETLADYKNVKIIQADALYLSDLSTYDVDSFGDTMGISAGKHGYKIVANLPYNIATFLIRSWLEIENPPKMMILMIQKEVAQRIVTQPPHSNLLGISVQFYADVKIIDYVKKESFWPKPKVDAAIIKIIPRKKPFVTSREAFFAVVKAGFSQPRKQLAGNLVKKLKIPREKILEIFQDLNISEKARAENLTIEDWGKITEKLEEN